MTDKRKNSILMAAIAAFVGAILLFFFYENPEGFKRFWKEVRDWVLGKVKKSDKATA